MAQRFHVSVQLCMNNCGWVVDGPTFSSVYQCVFICLIDACTARSVPSTLWPQTSTAMPHCVRQLRVAAAFPPLLVFYLSNTRVHGMQRFNAGPW